LIVLAYRTFEELCLTVPHRVACCLTYDVQDLAAYPGGHYQREGAINIELNVGTHKAMFQR
jgi:hypothetical protein